MKAIISALVDIFLCDCAAMGIKVDPNQVAQFHPGMTTYAEVVEKLGKPNAEQYDAEGVHAIKYVHSEASPFGASAQT